MTPEEQRTLDLFEAVASRPDINQRQLAEELGISLGLANMFLRTVLSKGWIRARKVKARRWLYILTPQGSLEKSRLSLNYLHRTLKSLRELRSKSDSVLSELSRQGVRGVHLIGDEDWTDIVRLCLDGHKVDCLSTINKPREEESVLNQWIPNRFPELKKSQRFLITLLIDHEEVVTKMKEHGYEEHTHWVKMV